MVNKCCVVECRSNYKGEKIVSVFSFPSDEHIKNLWIKFVNSREWQATSSARQHDLTPRIYVLHKITIALKFMSYINQKLRPSYQTALNLCLT